MEESNVLPLKEVSFLQSKEWEEFQNRIGRRTWRANGALIILHEIPLGFRYLYCPRPIGITERFYSEAEQIAKQERAIFLKVEPSEESRVKNQELRARASASIQPRETVIVNLQKTENELFQFMHEKTRYNIRTAERKSVKIQNPKSKIQNGAESFWKLLKETAERNRFHTHDRRYYEELLKTQSADFSNELFIAEHSGVPIAAALINFYNPSKTATYLHGASSGEQRDLMASHILHWEIIKEAKRRGFLKYDLWGIDEKKWPGVTRFKKRFGGDFVKHPASFDFIYRPFWYYVYGQARKLW